MPIEIRELVIRASVDPSGGGIGGSGATGGAAHGASSCGASGDKGGPGAGMASTNAVNPELIQACVREVMRILDRKAER